MDQIKLDVIKKAIDDKKGENIEAIETNGMNPFFDYVIIATVSNYRMANAIADEIEEKLALIKEEIHHVEGRNQETEWVLVDCHDCVVHLFTEQERARVNLEQLLTGKKAK